VIANDRVGDGVNGGLVLCVCIGGLLPVLEETGGVGEGAVVGCDVGSPVIISTTESRLEATSLGKAENSMESTSVVFASSSDDAILADAGPVRPVTDAGSDPDKEAT